MPTGTTILRPNASNFFTSVGWRSSPLTANNLWYTLVNETPPDGDTTFLWKSGGRNYNEVHFQNLLNGENPPSSENVTIKSCTIYMNCRDSAYAFPGGHSTASIEFLGWSPIRPTYYPVTGSYTYISSYWEQRTDGGVLRDITVADINSARCNIGVNLGVGVWFRVTQMYIKVNWETKSTVHIKGGTVLGGCLIK